MKPSSNVPNSSCPTFDASHKRAEEENGPQTNRWCINSGHCVWMPLYGLPRWFIQLVVATTIPPNCVRINWRVKIPLDGGVDALNHNCLAVIAPGLWSESGPSRPGQKDPKFSWRSRKASEVLEVVAQTPTYFVKHPRPVGRFRKRRKVNSLMP